MRAAVGRACVVVLITLTFQVSLPRDMDVRLRVFDVSGRLAKEIIRQHMTGGVHVLRWNLTAAGGAGSCS
ncbi:MAG TPA: hypothetical protein VMS88_08740 [Terriglobales bacterium]|nr:hypothetical protein [Terriglobales bacterium]